MPNLADNQFNKIRLLNQEAEDLMSEEQFEQAIAQYQKAWNTLPEPRQLWDVALWIKVGQTECYIALSDFVAAKKKLLEGILCAGAVSNPLVHLLLGICYFETGEQEQAKAELQQAYDLEGEGIFQAEDQKYKQFLLQQED